MFEETQCQNEHKGTKSVTRQKIEAAKKKCLQVVENLLEPLVSEDLVVSLCCFISQDDYLDVIEERNILGLCGYPLCSKLVKLIKQKYHISMKTNKVYDITERKCFCSNVCYKASNFLKAQLSACPVWLNEKDTEDKCITLLSTTQNSGSAGEEVDLGHTRMTTDDVEWVPDETSFENIYSSFMSDDLEASTTMFEKLEISEEHTTAQDTGSTGRTLTSEEKDQDGGDVMHVPKPNDGDHINISFIAEKYMEDSNSTEHSIMHHPYIDSDGDDDFADLSVEHEKYESLISNNKYMPVIPKTKVRKALLIEPVGNPDGVPRSPSAIEKISNSLQHIQNALMSWITVDTFHIILGENKFEMLKTEILENTEAPILNLDANRADNQEAMKQTYTKICLKLEKEEAIELNNKGESNENLGLEEEQLCESKEGLDKLKVSMFYKGKIGLPETSPNKKKSGKKSKSTPGKKTTRKEPSGKCPIKMKEMEPVAPSTSREITVLPVVDSMAQSAIRRQIVADHLKMVYLNLLPSVGLHYCDISEDFRLLIATFNLSSTNIIFKPPEWKMIAVILFRMLEKKLTTEKVWNQEKCWELLKAKLNSFGIELVQIDTVLASLTDHSRFKTLLLGY